MAQSSRAPLTGLAQSCTGAEWGWKISRDPGKTPAWIAPTLWRQAAVSTGSGPGPECLGLRHHKRQKLGNFRTFRVLDKTAKIGFLKYGRGVLVCGVCVCVCILVVVPAWSLGDKSQTYSYVSAFLSWGSNSYTFAEGIRLFVSSAFLAQHLAISIV